MTKKQIGEISSRTARITGKSCVISLPMECLGVSYRRIIAEDGTITLIPIARGGDEK